MSESRPPLAIDRIPISQKLAYGMGSIVTIVAVNSVIQLTGLVYVVGLGISAVWIGYAQALPRLWDALVDPFLGNLSDNTRTRYGRRIPYLVVGGVLLGIAFFLLWTVPRNWSHGAMFAYFLAASVFFYTVVPIYAIPHGALGLEMTEDPHEKTSLFAFASFIGNVGAFCLPWVYYLANRPVFKGDTVAGIRWVCLGMSAFLTISALVCAFVCKEGKFSQAREQARIPVMEGFKATYRNRAFLRLVAAFSLLIVGFQVVMGFSNFTTIFYLFGGDKDAASALMAQNGTLWAAVGIAGAIPMVWVSKALGKKGTVILSFALIAAANLLKIVCYDPARPWLTYIPTVGLSLGMVFCFSLVNSMIADICDEEEVREGVRKEGVYFAVYNWWWKAGVSVASVAGGYLLQGTGFVEGLATQSAAALWRLRLWEIGLPTALCGAGILILLGYPLTEARSYEVKEILQKRRAAAEPA
ncbi:MFS transporter [Mesoterricola sediminis]|uniref:Sugar transporter n=1 Tax=Mesoterricola sediminis TaxID=2927980 RepID=A0AA48GR51_9BACT|nr:MFS transporter [Mesoterricola sediminis]BDU76047.1 sugar transporter [Mesoterricola sediminis]